MAAATAALSVLFAAAVCAAAPPGESAEAGEAPQTGEAVRFRYANGHSEEISVRVWEGVPYLPVGEAARLVGARESWRPEVLQISLHVGGREITLITANPVAMIGGKAVLLSGPVRVWESAFWVPLDFATDDLVTFSGGRIAWSASRREFLVGRGTANIRGVVASRRAGRVVIDVETSKLLPCHVSRHGAHEVVVTLRGGVLPPDSLIARGDEAALVGPIRGEYVSDGALLRIALTRDLLDADATLSNDPVGVRVNLSFAGVVDTPPSPEANGVGFPSEREERSRLRITEPPPLPTVVIDPGHGGSDEGGLGAAGLREKDVTLAVALTLRTRIEQRLGLRVVLTRDTDVDVPLARRAEIANAAAGDLFLSLHCDSWRDPDVQGVAAYYLWTTSAEDVAVAIRGGAAGGIIGSQTALLPEPRFVRWEEAQAAVADQSIRFASIMAETMARELETRNRGAMEGPFGVLVGATMPAAVIEMGFLTNDEDEKLLGSPAYRDRVADTLFRGVEAFFQEVEAGAGGALGRAPEGAAPALLSREGSLSAGSAASASAPSGIDDWSPQEP